jgi:CheY-like chemotaxis protein
LPKKIVIADDSQFFLISLGLLLKRLGFRVIPAQNGEEALKIARKSEPHLILLDVNMKPTDGISVFSRLKEDDLISHIPVIFLSSVSDREVIRTCRDMGCSDYLLKPLKIRELHDAIQNCFSFPNGMSRKHLRVAFNKRVSLSHDGQRYELFSENLSAGGIYLRKNVPLRVGSKVDMVLPLHNTPMHVCGSVIYTRELFSGSFELPPGMAIEFKGLTRAQHQVLSDYIEKLLPRDIEEDPAASLDFTGDCKTGLVESVHRRESVPGGRD